MNSITVAIKHLTATPIQGFASPPSSVEGFSAFWCCISSPVSNLRFQIPASHLTCVDLPRISFFTTRGLFISYKNQPPRVYQHPPGSQISNPKSQIRRASRAALSLCVRKYIHLGWPFKPPAARIPEILGAHSDPERAGFPPRKVFLWREQWFFVATCLHEESKVVGRLRQ